MTRLSPSEISSSIEAAAGDARHFRLDCDLAAVREAARAARAFLSTHHIEGSELTGIELALVEACNNAVMYVRDDARHLPIEIQVCCRDDEVELQVTDHCRDFAWPERIELPEPDDEHGRGLYIIDSVMDHALYLRGPNENRLILRKLRANSGNGETSASMAEASDLPEANGAAAPATVEPPANAEAGAPPENLRRVRQKLALTEQVIGAMAKEICVRSEELAAIFRSTSELGRTTRIETFAQQLLEDLTRITATDWFLLRLASRKEPILVAANFPFPEARLEDLPLEPDSPHAEVRAALAQKDIFFSREQPLPPGDALETIARESGGMARPILIDGVLLGTLVLGQNNGEPLTREQIQVTQTFTNFLALHVLNARLREEQVDNELTARELDIARNIQKSLLPIKFPRLRSFGLSGFCLSARQVGGDFYDVLSLGEDRLLLVIADVMGKGVPAAMFAATLHTLVRTMAEWTHEPAELLSRINRFMYQELSAVDMFITVQLALADAEEDRLVVASAGHCPLLLTTTGGDIAALSPDGMPLGILPDAGFEETSMPLSQCLCGLLYTDGLTDARNAMGELYGQERLLAWMRDNGRQGQSAVQLSYAFLRDLKSFESQAGSRDDQTFLVLAREKTPSNGDASVPQPEGGGIALPRRVKGVVHV